MDDLISSARRKVVGTKETMKALERGEAKYVFIAGDAEERITRPIIALCEASEIEPQHVATMAELGKKFGIKVKAAAAAITEV